MTSSGVYFNVGSKSSSLFPVTRLLSSHLPYPPVTRPLSSYLPYPPVTRPLSSYLHLRPVQAFEQLYKGTLAI